MKKLLRPLLTLLSSLVVLAIIIYPKVENNLFSKKNDQPVSRGMRGSQQPLNVVGFVIKPSVITEYVNSTGTLLPDEEVDLSFETSGKIVSILFKEGTRVNKGDLLGKINDRHLQAQLLKLEAQHKLVEEKEFRQRSLLDKDAISRESYDQVVTELQSIEADILLIRARIAETELRAPFDGKIGLRFYSEGSYASPSTKIARLVKVSPLKIKFSIPERYAGEIVSGYPIIFTIDEKQYSAKVYAVEPMVDIKTRAIILSALYPNSNEELKPGRYAEVSLRLSELTNAISIPTEAIIPEMDGEKVFIYRSGKATKVEVSTGLRTESSIQITDGLNFGDTLITTGILQMREKLPVVLDTVIMN